MATSIGKVVAVFCTICVISCAAYPLFWHGRPRGGMIGTPKRRFSGPLPPDQWITQRLDHFDDANIETWQQRYFVNDTYFKGDGPVFLMIGGEGTANPIWMQEGTWIEWAQQMGALCLMLEHRYYGESHPTKDLSVDNLRYLSSEQGLADLAHFRNFMAKTKSLTKDNKWVSFGGSYPGSLSAWFRLKYPHLVDVAVATSAPVQAVMDFRGYLDVVRDSLATSKLGTKCNDNILSAVNQLNELLLHQVGWKTISDMFKLCKPLTGSKKNDVANLKETLAGNFMGVVQYNKDNRAFEGAVGTEITIDTLCGIMGNDSYKDNLTKYAAINSLILETYGEKCLDVSYDDMIKAMREVSWKSSAGEGGRQWVYQTCTEFGFFQTSDSNNQPFGADSFPLSFSLQQCMDIYGKHFNITTLAQGIERTNTNYGGTGIRATKVIYPNGSIDPWHALGILYDIPTEQKAIYINGTAHCANMYPALPNDPPELVKAREMIYTLIQTYLKES
ncbi:LOW QUALITY PROTEIN: putative serine protease K12H4.7 [Amphiura filiformis]|uniref:LOW QUALITY PROTEIN: putative serine protease K12H4.7 n=1 Tax=Amphiura filiformis TaxID=82378 RepID=UPI003B20C5D0